MQLTQKDLVSLEMFTKQFLSMSPINPLKFLVRYGAIGNDSDFDFLAIYEHPITHHDYSIGALDLFVLPESGFRYLLDSFDLSVTEPLLTGKLVFGNGNEWQKIKTNFLQLKPEPDDIFYLIARSFEIIKSAEADLESFCIKGVPTFVCSFWKNLSFAFSYFIFAELYSSGQYPIVFAKARERVKELDEVAQKVHKAKREKGKASSDLDLMNEALRNVKTKILQKIL